MVPTFMKEALRITKDMEKGDSAIILAMFTMEIGIKIRSVEQECIITTTGTSMKASSTIAREVERAL